MNFRFYTPVYSLTLLLSAALLFAVQPMFSKMILPMLGGTPQVWNTAMLFFQVMLLGGYAYAHGTTRYLGIRAQAVLHLMLLLLFVVVLPISIPSGWEPPTHDDPTLWQLSLMAITVGGPFFVLAGSAPMLQRWFMNSGHPDADDPYFLYGASNLGSMTALLAYPTVIEPLMTLTRQSEVWTGGYIFLIVCTLLAALLVWNSKKTKKTAQRKAGNDEAITWSRRLKWLLLAFVPSSLMLGVTTFITTDIASVPMLWIMPLALYVGTFIVVFARVPLISKKNIMLIQGFLMIALIAQMILFTPIPGFLIAFHMLVFLFSALACHTELADSRPHATHLTEFYLIMSLGGALGGFFNAIVAPQFFIIPFEYALALGAACFMRYASRKERFPKHLSANVIIAIAAVVLVFMTSNIDRYNHMAAQGILTFGIVLCLSFLIEKRWLFAMAVCGSLLFYLPGHQWGRFLFEKITHQDRSFFGVIKIVDANNGQRILLHGTTNHGTQALDEKHRMTPMSYYSTVSPVYDAFTLLNKREGTQNIAVMGLGIGVTACYKKKDRHFDFFEIDPKVAQIAEDPKYFTFLSDCGSPYEIILGDGRLTLRNMPDNYYDLILLDAFSSDNIPIHLLTLEAIELYFKKLKKDGILIFNISNNYLDIEPVLAKAAGHMNLAGYARLSDDGKIEGTEFQYYPAHFLILSRSDTLSEALEVKGWTRAEPRDGVNLWTDQYSNIFSVLGNKTGGRRLQELNKNTDSSLRPE